MHQELWFLMPVVGVMLWAYPARAAEDCSLKLITTINLETEDAAVFDVSIADKPYRMVLDASASSSLLSKQIADENHFTLKSLSSLPIMSDMAGVEGRRGRSARSDWSDIFRQTVTVDGKALTQYAPVPSLVFGGMDLKEYPMVVVPDWTEPVAGVLGGVFMYQFDVELDLAHKKISLYLKDHCAGQVVYWTDQYTKFPFRRGAYNNVVFAADLDGEKIDASFDTRRPASRIDRRTAETRFNVTGDASTGAAPAGAFKRLALGGVGIGGPQIDLAKMPECKSDGKSKATAAYDNAQAPDCGFTPLNIGTNMARKLRIYFETNERMIYISAANATK